MRNLQFTGKHYDKWITLKQISKAEAKKLFANNETVYLQSSNMNPFGVWQNAHGIELNKEQLKNDIEYYNWCKDGNYILPVYSPDANGQFDRIINEYSYYNCDSERGKYITYYKAI